MPELCGEHWIIAIGLFEKNILPKQLCSEQYDFNTSDKFFLSVWDSLQSLKKTGRQQVTRALHSSCAPWTLFLLVQGHQKMSMLLGIEMDKLFMLFSYKIDNKHVADSRGT